MALTTLDRNIDYGARSSVLAVAVYGEQKHRRDAEHNCRQEEQLRHDFIPRVARVGRLPKRPASAFPPHRSRTLASAWRRGQMARTGSGPRWCRPKCNRRAATRLGETRRADHRAGRCRSRSSSKRRGRERALAWPSSRSDASARRRWRDDPGGRSAAQTPAVHTVILQGSR